MVKTIKMGLWLGVAVGLIWVGATFAKACFESRQHELVGTRIPYQGKTLKVWSAAEIDDGHFVLDAAWEEEKAP